jgi:AraC-like DNA-binding protein
MSGLVEELLGIWFIFSASIGLWTFSNLMFMKNASRSTNAILILFVAALLVPSVNGYVQLTQDIPFHPLQTLSQNLTWLYGPLLYLLVKKTLLQSVRWRFVFLHLSPFVFVNLDKQFGSILTDQSLTFYCLLFTYTLFYIVAAIHLVYVEKLRLTRLLTGHKNSRYFWLLFICCGFLALIVLDISVILMFFTNTLPNLHIAAFIACCINVYVCVIALFTVHQPQLFQISEINSDSLKKFEDAVKVPRNVELSAEAAKQLNLQLTELVASHKPHLDDEISLTKLAALLGVTRNQLSELFNVHNATTFYDFLNELRYQESLNLLALNGTENSIGDIAYRAGFNNRNTFYKVFKDKNGITPSEFRKHKGHG